MTGNTIQTKTYTWWSADGVNMVPVTTSDPFPVQVVGGGTGGNASVGLTGVTAPTSATEIGIVDGTGKLTNVSSTNPLPISGTISATSAITAVAALPTLSPGSQSPRGSLAGATYVQPVYGSSTGGGTQVDGTHGLPVSIDQTTPGSTNAVNVTNLPNVVDTNSGNKSASTIRVVLATDQPTMTNPQPVTVSAGSAVIGHVITDSGSVAAVTNAGTFATQLTGSTNNINNVSGTVSLPTGASTSAKQPALGTAGTASSDVLTIQGITSMTPLSVSASSLPLPTGAATSALQTTGNSTLTTINTTLGTPMQATGGTVGLVAGTAVIGHVINDASSAVIGHVITDTGSTTAVTGNVTVVQPTGTNLHCVLDTTSTTAVTQATAASLNATVVGTGTFATQAAQSGTWNIGTVTTITGVTTAFGATAASVPANAGYDGKRGTTANPTAVTDGQLVGAMADKVGRQVVVLGGVRDLVSDQVTSITGTSETTVVTAGGAGVFNDLVSINLTNSGATAVELTLREDTAGTIRGYFYVPAGDMRGQTYTVPFKGASNKPWTIQSSGSTTTLRVTAQFIKNI